jgi:hypothetical protein
MEMLVHYDSEVLNKLPELAVCLGVINNVCAAKDNEHLQRLKRTAYAQAKTKCNIGTLKEDQAVSAREAVETTLIY